MATLKIPGLDLSLPPPSASLSALDPSLHPPDVVNMPAAQPTVFDSSLHSPDPPLSGLDASTKSPTLPQLNLDFSLPPPSAPLSALDPSLPALDPSLPALDLANAPDTQPSPIDASLPSATAAATEPSIPNPSLQPNSAGAREPPASPPTPPRRPPRRQPQATSQQPQATSQQPPHPHQPSFPTTASAPEAAPIPSPPRGRQKWSRPELSRLLHGLAIAGADMARVARVVGSRAPAAVEARLLSVAERCGAGAASATPTPVAVHAVLHYHRLAGPPAWRGGAGRSGTSAGGAKKVAVRVSPALEGQGRELRGRGFNPCVEVVLGERKCVWDILFHLYSKWGRAVVLQDPRADALAIEAGVGWLRDEFGKEGGSGGGGVVGLRYTLLDVKVDFGVLLGKKKGRGRGQGGAGEPERETDGSAGVGEEKTNEAVNFLPEKERVEVVGVTGRKRTYSLAVETGPGDDVEAAVVASLPEKKARVEAEVKVAKEKTAEQIDLSDWAGAGGGGMLPEGVGEIGSAGPIETAAFPWDGKGGLSQFRSLSLGLRLSHLSPGQPGNGYFNSVAGDKDVLRPDAPSPGLGQSIVTNGKPGSGSATSKSGANNSGEPDEVRNDTEAEFHLTTMHPSVLEEEGAAAGLEDLRRMHSQSGSDSMVVLSSTALRPGGAISFPSLSTSLLGKFDADIVDSGRDLVSPASAVYGSASASLSGGSVRSGDLADRCLRNDNALDSFAMSGEQKNCSRGSEPLASSIVDQVEPGNLKVAESDRLTPVPSVDLNLSLNFANTLPDIGLSKSLVQPSTASRSDDAFSQI